MIREISLRKPQALRKKVLQRSKDELFQEIIVGKEVPGASLMTYTERAKR